MPPKATSSRTSAVLSRERYRVLRNNGIPIVEAKYGCTGGVRFTEVMTRHGLAAEAYPKLALERHGGDPTGKGFVKFHAERRKA